MHGCTAGGDLLARNGEGRSWQNMCDAAANLGPPDRPFKLPLTGLKTLHSRL